MVTLSRQEYLTVQQVVSWGLCGDWPKERVESYAAGRKSVKLFDVLDDDSLSVSDRLCVGSRALEDYYPIGYWAAERAVHVHALKSLDGLRKTEQAQLIRDLPTVTGKSTAIIANRICTCIEVKVGMTYCEAEPLDRAAWAAYYSYTSNFKDEDPYPDAYLSIQYCVMAASCTARVLADDRDKPMAIDAARESEEIFCLRHLRGILPGELDLR